MTHNLSDARTLEFYKWKLNKVMPLFQEARDALCALTVTQVRLHNISPSLADRMDSAGTAGIAQWVEEVGEMDK